METTDDEKERLRLNNDSETPAAMMTGEIAQASVVRHQEQGAFGDAPRVWPKEDLDCESRSERSADVSQVFNRHTASASMDGSVAETSASAITRRRPKMTTMAGGAGVASDDDEGHFDGDGECRSSGSGSIRGDGHERRSDDNTTSLRRARAAVDGPDVDSHFTSGVCEEVVGDAFERVDESRQNARFGRV